MNEELLVNPKQRKSTVQQSKTPNQLNTDSPLKPKTADSMRIKSAKSLDGEEPLP